MTAKKSTKTTKTKTSKTHAAKATNSRAAKPAKAVSTAKTVHATEPYHFCFGLILILIAIITSVALIVGIVTSFRYNSMTDSEAFSLEYKDVEKDNVFSYVSAEKAIKIIEEGTGVVFLGFPECPWCQAYAPMLDELAKKYGVETIYYHNTYKDREENTEAYQKLVSLLSNYLQLDENGNSRIYVPDVVFVIDGEIIGNNLETSKDTLGFEKPEDYWTEERVATWKQKVEALFERIKAAVTK